MIKKLFLVMILALSFNQTPEVLGIQKSAHPLQKEQSKNTNDTSQMLKAAAVPGVAIVGGGLIGGMLGGAVSYFAQATQELKSYIGAGGAIGVIFGVLGLISLENYNHENTKTNDAIDELIKRVDKLEKEKRCK